MARKQAEAFLAREANWILLPISLGGRSFLSFDDIVIAELVNRYRFQHYYYQAFIELIRLGVLVPAFDGFEEMFVEGSSGEALSALGGLMGDLHSEGAVLVSARQAYFEYAKFSTQAKLFDAIGDSDVSFARLGLNRWDREKFIEYAELSGVKDAAGVYEQVSARFSPTHPLLTRAVLVKRLVEVARVGGVYSLLERLGTDPDDYFYQFVDTIVEREATEKWMDRSGTLRQPLLTSDEHHELLSLIAKEMWLSSSDALKGDYLDLVAELFSNENGKSAAVTGQVIRRLRQHSLIRFDSAVGSSYSFDHEDFRYFYLGEAFGEVLSLGEREPLVALLAKAQISRSTANAAVAAAVRRGCVVQDALKKLQSLAASSSPSSYISGNVGALVARFLESLEAGSRTHLAGIMFPPDAIKGRAIREVDFEDCHFLGTSLEGSTVKNCHFTECKFDRLEWVDGLRVDAVELRDCDVACVALSSDGGSLYSPRDIRSSLENVGFEVYIGADGGGDQGEVDAVPDENTLIAEHALRKFLRATHLNEDVFRQQFGKRTAEFFDEVLPEMLTAEVLLEVAYKGSGRQRRFKLNVPMRNIEAAIPASVGSLREFLSDVRKGKRL
jgi:hypothetical protein